MAEVTAVPDRLRQLSVELERTVDRLRSRSLARLQRPWDPADVGGPSAAQAALVLAQRLADATAALESSPRRTLPDAEPHVVPDVLAVCGHDLLLALVERPEAQTPAEEAAAELRRFRRLL